MSYCSSVLRRGPSSLRVRPGSHNLLMPKGPEEEEQRLLSAGGDTTQPLPLRSISPDEGVLLWRKPPFPSPFAKLLPSQSRGGGEAQDT